MKKYIRANEDSDQITSANLLNLLRSNGIDTTKAKYELYAESYERYGGGEKYRFSFMCPGDWLAFLAMKLHEPVTPQNLEEHFGDMYELEELVADCPTVDAIAKRASEYWWGDGDDYIFYLKNLNTGEMLYESESDEGSWRGDYGDEWDD